MANAMRFTTTELAELETKIANAADRALAIELAVFDRLVGRGGGACRRDPRRRGSACRARRVGSACGARRSAKHYSRPLVDGSLAFAIEGGRHPVVEQALRRAAESAVRGQ